MNSELKRFIKDLPLLVVVLVLIASAAYVNTVYMPWHTP